MRDLDKPAALFPILEQVIYGVLGLGVLAAMILLAAGV